VLHLDPGTKETAPLRFVCLRESVSRWSRERRKAETRLKLACRGTELRSIEETRESLQEMPVKVHGSTSGSQLRRMAGFGRPALKLMSWWVSLLGEAEDEADDAWREKKVRERRNREKWEFEGQNGFIFEAVKGVGVFRLSELPLERA
jgi:hypothetical protein